jgi:hypothetical protein
MPPAKGSRSRRTWSLTDSDATKFWLIWTTEFTAELVKINVRRRSASGYADHWGSLTDDQAIALAKQCVAGSRRPGRATAGEVFPIVTQAIVQKEAATLCNSSVAFRC